MSSDLSGLVRALGEAVRAYQASVDDFDRETARLLGVNETDLRCLEVLLQDLPEASPGQLAERLGLTSGSATTMLDRLAHAGFVERSPHPSDRRRTVVTATPEAAQRAQAIVMPLVADGERMLRDAYDADTLRVLIDFLTRARDLEEHHVARLRADDGR